MASILVVGAADTGRAPLAAALLRHMLRERGIEAEVSSAGVIGHDGDELQTQAALTLEHLGIRPPEHRARSLNDAIAGSATLLLAIDRGTARVLMVRYLNLGERIAALPQLAGSRDVPDPFHMTLDAWIVYGRAIEEQLRAALPEIIKRLEAAVEDSTEPEASAPPADGRPIHIARMRRILSAIEAAPEIIDWSRARDLLIGALAAVGSEAQPGDMTPAVTALAQGLLAQQAALLTPGQAGWLVEIATALEEPIDGETMARIAASAARWSLL